MRRGLYCLMVAALGASMSACASAPALTQAPSVASAPQDRSPAGPDLPQLSLPYKRFVLPNGLRLIVHEDKKAPVVAVNVWYHVGSKNERPGRTGFAHLFEHLMFQGSENAPGEYFAPLEAVGATDMNGTTNRDRTNYFQTVPKTALDVALFMESDRMGHFQSSITQALLDEQREVVKNEKRQNVINQPYGRVRILASEMAYPPEHPYSWTTIGRMKDLDAASLEDVRQWFADYYGASNAVVTIAGDITPEEALEKVQKYFGHIPPGPPVARMGRWVAPMTQHRRTTMLDKVSQARVYRIYNVPEWGNDQLEHLRLAAWALGSGKNARLYKRLVYEEQLATDVGVYVAEGEVGSQLWIYATARPDVPLERVEALLDEELARFTSEGPRQEELDRARTQFFAAMVRRLERVGGWGKADLLAMSEVYGQSPEAFERQWSGFRAATAQEVHQAARQWLVPGSLTISVLPQPAWQAPAAQAAPAEPRKLPEAQGAPDIASPTLERMRLSNGLEVIVASRRSTPLVQARMLVRGGHAADLLDRPGTMRLLENMLDEGTQTRTALAISGQLDDLGATIQTDSNLDTTQVTLEATTQVFPQALDVFADVLQNPSFPEAELARLRNQTLAAIAQEKTAPMSMALRTLGPLLFGKEHPYGVPLTGSGYEQDVQGVQRDTLVRLHGELFQPANMQLVIAGDVDLATIKPLLEDKLGRWQPGPLAKSGAAQKVARPVPAATRHPRPRLFLVDKPGAAQSMVIAGQAIASRKELDQPLADVLNDIFGGTFTSRINMNLREDKGWTYGARSAIWQTTGPQIFMTYAAVQSDRTAESLSEMRRELAELISTRPPREDELQKVRQRRTMRVPGELEAVASLLGNATEIVKYGLPDDYLTQSLARVQQARVEDLARIAPQIVSLENMTWVVVGDRDKIEGPLRALGIAEIEVVEQ